jgi:hypothetical protein
MLGRMKHRHIGADFRENDERRQPADTRS